MLYSCIRLMDRSVSMLQGASTFSTAQKLNRRNALDAQLAVRRQVQQGAAGRWLECGACTNRHEANRASASSWFHSACPTLTVPAAKRASADRLLSATRVCAVIKLICNNIKINQNNTITHDNSF